MKIFFNIFYVASLIMPIIFLPAEPAKNSIYLSFSAFSLTGEITNLFYFSDNEEIEFCAPSYRRSKDLHYKGNTDISFYRRVNDKIEYIGKVFFTQNIRRPLILFSKNNNNFNVMIIEDEISIFNLGSIRFINLTKNENKLIIALGENAQIKKFLPPKGIVSYNINNRDVGNLRFQIAGIDKNNHAKILKDAIIFPEMEARYIYFIYQPKKDKDYYKISMLKERVSSSITKL